MIINFIEEFKFKCVHIIFNSRNYQHKFHKYRFFVKIMCVNLHSKSLNKSTQRMQTSSEAYVTRNCVNLTQSFPRKDMHGKVQ